MPTLPVQILTHRVLRHWQTIAPHRYQHLKKTEQLLPAASATAQRLTGAINSWIASGLTSRQAWEKAHRLDLLDLPSQAMPQNDLMDVTANLQDILRTLESETD